MGGVYISERTGNRIQEFDLNGGFIRSWGSMGSADGQFYQPRGIAVGSDGSVYVTDWFNVRVQKFDSTGTFLAKWDWSSIGGPNGIAVDAQGNLLVADAINHRVVKMDPVSGSVLTTFGSQGNGPGQFDLPKKIGVAASGYIYVSDANLHFVSMFVPAGVDAGPWGPATHGFAVYGSTPEPITSGERSVSSCPGRGP